VLWNLLDNGLQHTPPGGRVMLSARAAADGIRCAVRDTGRGIPAEHVPLLFDSFWQGDAAEGGGAGLGLSICRAIVEAHGGEIRVESEPGQGSTFEFRIPAAADDVADD
jgi:signal transduction histidine kinase